MQANEVKQMTIRKRYEEAEDLIRRGLYEPALILLLVAFAAASERYRKDKTGNAKKKPGDDKKSFCLYVTSQMSMPGDIAITLYKDLRCEIIHEATTSAGVWSSSANNFLDTKSGRITFGVQLLSALMRAVKHDPLGRNEFRDILSEFDNIIEYNGPE